MPKINFHRVFILVSALVVLTAANVHADVFRVVASNEAGVQGASGAELSLFIAEKEAFKDCTRRSEYQGECEILRVGPFELRGDDRQKDQLRWQYMQSVHQSLATARPLRNSLQAKVLAPGSRVGDAYLWMSNSFKDGGYVALQMPSYSCTGTMDPIVSDDKKPAEEPHVPIGLVEFACQSGGILKGGYVSLDAQTKLFYLEDSERERWDFLISNRASSIGYNRVAFKELFVELEESE